jgi:hypothetical protein
MEATRQALENYRQGANATFAPLNDFAARLQDAEPDFSAAKADPEVAQIAHRIWNTAKDFSFLYRVAELKMDWIAQALLDGLRAENPLSIANTTRALLEHLAALNFLVTRARRLLDGLQGQGSKPKADEHFDRTDKVFQRCYYGHSPKAQGTDLKAYHIESDYLEGFRTKYPRIVEVYAFLCEYVHPNHGSNVLVSAGTLGVGLLRPPISTHADALTRICACAIGCVHSARELFYEFGAAISLFQKYLELAQQPGIRFKTLFSVRSTVAQGDGRTKETAIFFPGARTHIEGLEMIYRYLEEKRLKVGPQQLGGIDERFVYDIIETQAGPLWFKIPSTGWPRRNNS